VPPLSFDLQSHSVHSDGVLPAAEVVARAATAGIELLALSDHDTVAGVPEAREAAAKHGIDLVPAVEISSIDPLHSDFHVLGYGVDVTDSTLLDRLQAFRDDRLGRSDRMRERLEELGWAIDPAPLQARTAQGKPIGRPHLAAAAFGHPDNAARVRDEGFATPSDLLVAYLIEDKPAFVRRTMPTVPQAIEAIHDAGGVAVWAHPFWDLDDTQQTLDALERFAGYGIDGVEAFYITHTREQTLALDDAATARGLLTTGSADFHGPEHPHFSAFGAFELYEREPNLGPIPGHR
jgi:3',5'-nucleoside bisphosphate phosphatase